MDSLHRFYQMRSRYLEGAEAFGLAASHLGNASDKLLAHLLLIEGWFLQYMGMAHGREVFLKGVTLLRQTGNFTSMPMPLMQLTMFNEQGDYEEILHNYQEYYSAASAKGDHWAEAWYFCCMGLLALVVRKYPEAQQFYRESQRRFQALGDRW